MRIWIPHKFPSLNEYINAERRHRMMAANIKKKWTELVRAEALAQVSEPALAIAIEEYPIKIHFIVHEQNTRRDIDNVSSMVSKFCLDGLVKAGILPDDSQKYVNKIECDLVVDGEVGVEVIL